MSRIKNVFEGEDITVLPGVCYQIVKLVKNWLICLYYDCFVWDIILAKLMDLLTD